MNTGPNRRRPSLPVPARSPTRRGLMALLAVFLGVLGAWGQSPAPDASGIQVLTRGPVHEAFAGVVTFNPEPGVVVSKAPPEPIEEVPPDERPEGDSVSWIPGYWAWDDERADFLWVSGTWRALPPGRAWMAGYWAQTPQGHQWISGYWADAAVRETTYLPPPPETIEAGPSVAAPSADYGWAPGGWVWYRGRYAWRPGYWVLGRADWNWSPAHYVWTPRGYLFVGGFWDYPVERRGVLFAPVYFDVGVRFRRGYSYSPRIVLDLGVFSAHLFLRPHYAHYYFGDYYAPSYVQGGFYTSFAFYSGGHGYDPIFAHQRWEHRQDRDWEHRLRIAYEDRRDHEGNRPPRTWADPRNRDSGPADTRSDRARMALPIRQLAERNDGPLRFQPVAKEERQQLARRGQEVQQSREQRRTLETRATVPAASRPGTRNEPAKVQLPRSPIVARPSTSGGRNQAPPPAEPKQPGSSPLPGERSPRASQLLPSPHARSVEPTRRAPTVDRIAPQPAPRATVPETRPAPRRVDLSPRAQQHQSAPGPRPRVAATPRGTQPPTTSPSAPGNPNDTGKPTSPGERRR